MSDAPTSNVSEFTVSELSGSIKKTVEGAFSHVRLRGEISGFRGPHSSGHAYFSIKDDRARMDAVIWKGVYNRLKFKPEEGMEMIATGKVTTYPGSSKYQIVIENLEPAGAGALMALLEERKKKLAAEGLFNPERKQLLPFMPNVIGVVTSPTGAVIRDILHRLSDRFPVHVVVWPVRVQGETSGDEVAAAINGFNGDLSEFGVPKPDLIIVARGGGSLEDLWGFNDEAVVRAASQSDIPLISAVGHETDWTLLDLVADERAPTPTGAAEMAVPVKADLEATIANMAARLQSASSRMVGQRRQHFQALSRGLPSLDNLLALPRRRVDEIGSQLGKTFQFSLVNKRRIYEQRAGKLTPLSLKSSLQNRRSQLSQLGRSLDVAGERHRDQRRANLTRTARALLPVPQQLQRRILQMKDRLSQSSIRSQNALAVRIERSRQKFQASERLLHSLSHKRVLDRGFAIVRGPDHKLVTSSQMAPDGEALSIQFSDGAVDVVRTNAEEITISKLKKKATKAKRAPETKGNDQGTLF